MDQIFAGYESWPWTAKVYFGIALFSSLILVVQLLLSFLGAAHHGVDADVGADLDLDGDWAQDVDVTIDVMMGGVEVDLPDDVRAVGLDDVEGGSRIPRGDAEMPERTMRFDVNARMGGIEVSR